ncbi:hypothetical protein BC832DRAFT_281211 [Gaertneriomyces semiglobifer]|nr:hypothetical protein BC832DRAFT_281211 [Gaertneriomyces semiglobifer]
MRLVQPLILLSLGALFLYFLLLLSLPHPVPKVLGRARVEFEGLQEEWTERALGFIIGREQGGDVGSDADPESQERKVHVAWMGQADDVASVQHYVFPMPSYRNGTKSAKAETITARNVYSRSIQGTVTQLALKRLNPVMMMVYRRLDEANESMRYVVDRTDIVIPATLPDEEPICKLRKGQSPSQETTINWICTQPNPFTYDTMELPGNLAIERFSIARENKILYSRRFDKYMWRTMDFDGSKSVGPEVQHSLGRQLVTLELHSPSPARKVFFSVSYAHNEDHYRVMMCIFEKDGNEPWVKHEMWKDDFIAKQKSLYSPILEHDVLESDRGDMLYWLTLPVVGSSPSGKHFAFIFLGRMFVLDYNENESGAGYVLDDRYEVDGLSASQLRMKGAQMSSDGTVVVFVNEMDDIMTFKRPGPHGTTHSFSTRGSDTQSSPSSQLSDNLSPDATQSDESRQPSIWEDIETLFSIPHELAFFFEAGIPSKQRKSSQRHSQPEWHMGKWGLQSVWPNKMSGGDVVVGFTLLEDSEAQEQQEPSKKVARRTSSSAAPVSVLILSTSLTTPATHTLLHLQPSLQYSSTSYFHLFWMNKWPMIVGMLAVIAVFVGNEMRTSQYVPRPLVSLYVSGLMFWVLLFLVFGEG